MRHALSELRLHSKERFSFCDGICGVVEWLASAAQSIYPDAQGHFELVVGSGLDGCSTMCRRNLRLHLYRLGFEVHEMSRQVGLFCTARVWWRP